MPVLCNLVRLLCKESILVYPFYKTIKIGDDLGPCKVGYCHPNPCMLVPSSKISVEEYVEYRTRELDKNMLVELHFTSGNRDVYVYPKHIWEEMLRRFIDPLSKGEPPKEGGAILYGPPGTGKTSMAKILTWIQGLYRVDVSPEMILSKWVGESESRLHNIMSMAEAYEPSIVLFDDAEWLVRSRQSISGGEDVGVFLGLMNILLRKIEEWKREKHMIISVITTNVSEDKIDPALRRSGRLGRPIFVPLPDFEAVYTLLKELGVDDKKAEQLAIKIVNAGLPMSDAVTIAHEVLDGKEPKIEPIKGRGYVRLVPPVLPSECRTYLGKYRDLCSVLRRGTRIWVPMESTVSIPLVASLVGVVCKKPVVVMNDQRYFDEAVMTADTNDAVLIVNHDYVQPDYVKLIHVMASSPVIYCGKTRPEVIAVHVKFRYESVQEREAVFKILAKFYDIKYKQDELCDIGKMSDKAYERLIAGMGIYRGPLNVIRKRLAPIG